MFQERVFFESVAAMQALCRLTGNLECKIEEIEKLSKKLTYMAKLRQLRSTLSLGMAL